MITAALHGAKVIVDEKGTEAAAATAMAFDESAGPQADLTVVADRPFLGAITHQETGALLFIRTLGRPNFLGGTSTEFRSRPTSANLRKMA